MNIKHVFFTTALLLSGVMQTIKLMDPTTQESLESTIKQRLYNRECFWVNLPEMVLIEAINKHSPYGWHRFVNEKDIANVKTDINTLNTQSANLGITDSPYMDKDKAGILLKYFNQEQLLQFINENINDMTKRYNSLVQEHNDLAVNWNNNMKDQQALQRKQNTVNGLSFMERIALEMLQTEEQTLRNNFESLKKKTDRLLHFEI